MTSQRIAGGTVHKMPFDFRMAIESDAAARSLWIDITPLARNEWICWVTSPKKEETRKRRIEVGIDKMRKGMRRPCCWPGCPHR
ncbi:MAG: YdeI/OmpD-associated family protein [Acidobacteria bacterium]|nr:YdeI/OmpD-associated family protein [Acidobacteriota bacterium]